jgi:hypothetical protein
MALNQASLFRMNLLSLRRCWILLAVLVALGGGCTSMESVRSTVNDRVGGVPPRVRTVNGGLPRVYEAARQAMERLGYHFTGGGPAQGRLEGFSRIEGDDNFRSSRQRGISIRLAGLEGDRVELQVKMTELIEEDSSRSAMPAIETPVRDPAAYEVFFNEVERRLAP